MTTDQTKQDDAAKITELIESSNDMAMLTTRAPDGTLTSRPMALQKAEFTGDLWFFAARSSAKLDHIASDPQVNVTFGSASTWVSFTGHASIVTDLAKKKELWNTFVEAWFPEGPDSDEIILVKVDGDSAEYWESPGGRIATLISLAKAKVTGEPYSGGDNETVEL